MNLMKPIITIFAFLLLCCSACKEEIPIYEGESGIYFSTQNIMLDTIFVPWGLKESEVTEQEYTLKVCLFGAVKPYDRKFSVRVNADASDTLAAVEGVDFRALDEEWKISYVACAPYSVRSQDCCIGADCHCHCTSKVV